jgi:post-segregation antitoxin (ccd killing protein)
MAMNRSIHVRLDDAAEGAVADLRARGINVSQVIRDALHARAQRDRDRDLLREECRRLADDPADRAEILAIREEMRDLMPVCGEE